MERLDQLVQLAPWHDFVDLIEKPISPRELFLGGVFEVRDTSLLSCLGAQAILLPPADQTF